MSKIRYAILVGINDYKAPDELHYCDNDVLQLKKRLISNCNFLDDNIKVIISTENAPVNVLEKYKDELEKLKPSINDETDCVLFYFSGHGKYLDETYLEFHEIKVKMQDIFTDINSLGTFHKIFILDACHSGMDIEFKNRAELSGMNEYYSQRYIADSDGVFFLCSCKADERSAAIPKYKNGLFTKYLLDAIDNNKLYNSETNCLSLFNIHEYALIKILYNGDYKQTPFIQTQLSGYYPFAFFEKKPDIHQCNIKLKSESDEDVVAFFMNESLKLENNLRRDLIQFVTEIVLNLFHHNYANSVFLEMSDNQLIITDYSNSTFNTFEAASRDGGQGLKVYKLFIEKYDAVCQMEFVAGPPNKYIFSFDELESIFQAINPCNIKIREMSLVKAEHLKNYNFELECDEIVVDISMSNIALSISYRMLGYLIHATEAKKPLIILKMHDEDMLKKEVGLLIKRNERFQRIMLV